MKRGHLNLALLGLTLDDLALDCIADLFQREEDGRFTQIVTYFQSRDWERLDECDLNTALRRLIFSQVNEGLFRRYREADSGLAKIIRNIKIAAKADRSITLERHGREQWLVVRSAESSRASLPTISGDMVEACLASTLEYNDSIPQAVEAVRSLLEREDEFAGGYPVTGLAQAVRAAYSYIHTPLVDNSDDEKPFMSSEIARIIRESAREIEQSKRDTYVASGKVTESLYSNYFRAVIDALRSEFVSGSEPVDSYFTALAGYIPNLTSDEYASDHRNVLEYLVKLTRGRLLSYMRQDARAVRSLAA